MASAVFPTAAMWLNAVRWLRLSLRNLHDQRNKNPGSGIPHIASPVVGLTPPSFYELTMAVSMWPWEGCS